MTLGKALDATGYDDDEEKKNEYKRVMERMNIMVTLKKAFLTLSAIRTKAVLKNNILKSLKRK